MKTYLPIVAAVIVSLGAIAFVVWPAIRRNPAPWKAKALIGGALALFVFGLGSGLYLIVGAPDIALRDAKPLDQLTQEGDVNGLAHFLIQKVRENPKDQQGWLYLAQVYMAAGDAGNSARALGKAVALGREKGAAGPQLESAYGQALVRASGGAVPPDAETAFRNAVAANPDDTPARFYLGLAAAARNDRATAERYWRELLEQAEPASPLYQVLVDRLASIGAAPGGGGGTPDIQKMVSQLADRLAKDPNDAAGWQRLIRAYAVLGETAKAKEALASARDTVGKDAAVKAALDAQARQLKLD